MAPTASQSKQLKLLIVNYIIGLGNNKPQQQVQLYPKDVQPISKAIPSSQKYTRNKLIICPGIYKIKNNYN